MPPGPAVALALIAVASSLLLAGSSVSGTTSALPSAATASEDLQTPEVSASSEASSTQEHVTGSVDAEKYTSGDTEDAHGFLTPSGKWLCAIDPVKEMAGCASHIEGAPPSIPGTLQIPAQDSGPSAETNIITVEVGKEPSFQTANQPLFTGNANVLPYGSTLAVDGFSCNVQFSGVSCKEDATGQGFTISTNGYKFEFTPIPGSALGNSPQQITPAEPTAPPLPQLGSGSNQCGPVIHPPTGKPATVVIVKGTIRCDAAHAMLNKYFTAGAQTDSVYRFDGWECTTKGDPHSAETGYSISCTDADSNIVVAQP
ncbi:hypothetical protein [Rhodococcus tibetensis]|uniref:Uncharacterized protein n=1 Tax=Rhodococcus tibetensis TaxID=2965064 RepID=A0ABT1Q8N4_9NOCA|nr:hypothetical protein [Rhodococcus sp. FXJ9.536]MCQ4118607.1 hypothetical protein [Rhodococcus sp. FXJ9.536]